MKIKDILFRSTQGVKDFKRLMSSFGRLKAMTKRQSAAKTRTEDAAATKQPVPALPAYTAFCETAPGDDVNSNSSLLLTLAGVKVSVLEPTAKGKDIVEAIANDPGYKFAQREVVKHMNTGVAASYRALAEEAKFRKLNKTLRVAFDRMCFASHATGKADWSMTLWTPQTFRIAERHFWCGISHFCCIEARLLISGKVLIFGAPVNVVPGDTLRSKKEHLMTGTAQSIQELFKCDGAFVVHHLPGKLLVMPSGYLYMMAYVEESTGLRWSLASDDADSARVLGMVDNAMQHFPELRAKGYESFSTWLRG